MRKLLLVALMAVSACAWADVEGPDPDLPETYNWMGAIYSFSHNSIHGLPIDTQLKLIDVEDGRVLAQLNLSDLHGSAEGVSHAVSVPKNNSLQADFSAYWGIGPDQQHGGYYLTLNINDMKFPNGTFVKYIDPTVEGNTYVEGGHTYLNKVGIVISSAEANMSQTLAIEVASNGGNLSSSAVFSPGPVPEPTSTMLLLLGVTGLMLKRKRA